MILQIRTKDNLEELLKQSNSPAWIIAEAREKDIQQVEIFQFDGKRVLKADFDKDYSFRTQEGRLVVFFKNGKIEDADHKWIGQNPVKYVGEVIEDKNEIDKNDSKKIVFARQLGNEDTSYVGAQIALKELNIEQVSSLLNLLENKQVTNNENDFLTQYFYETKLHTIGILINDEEGDLDNLSDIDNYSSDIELDFQKTEDGWYNPRKINNDFTDILSKVGFFLITIRFEDFYLIREGESGLSIYPGLTKIPHIGALIFDESEFMLLDQLYQSNNSIHIYDDKKGEYISKWNNMKEMEGYDGDGDANIYATYQILLYSKKTKIDFENLDVDEIKEAIGENNTIIYSNREYPKLSNVVVDEDISPYQFKNNEFDEDMLIQKINYFRKLLKKAL